MSSKQKISQRRARESWRRTKKRYAMTIGRMVIGQQFNTGIISIEEARRIALSALDRQ
jgi:hypothetical protein